MLSMHSENLRWKLQGWHLYYLVTLDLNVLILHELNVLLYQIPFSKVNIILSARFWTSYTFSLFDL